MWTFIEMTLNGCIVASVHTTVTFQAFNGFEDEMVGLSFFVHIPKEWSQEVDGLVVAGAVRQAHLIGGEDTYVLTPGAIMGFHH